MIAHRAFVGAVAAARGISVKAVEALDGDMLTGSAAVAAGLADAVAPVEDVERWALYRAAGDRAMAEDTKAGGEMPPEKPGESPADASGCKRCGEMPGDEARYCAKCGEKVGAEMPAEDPEDDDAPESSKPAARLAPTGGSVATMLGLRADASEPTIKTALADLLSEARHVRGVLKTDASGVRGALKALSENAARSAKLGADLKAERKANETRERTDHLLALSNRLGLTDPSLSRSELLEDVLGADAAGNEVVIGVRPKPGNPIANAPIADLRAYAAGKLANVSAEAASPFAPGEDDARTRADKAAANVTAADRETAQRTGRKPEDVAASRRALFPNANGAPRALIGG